MNVQWVPFKAYEEVKAKVSSGVNYSDSYKTYYQQKHGICTLKVRHRARNNNTNHL